MTLRWPSTVVATRRPEVRMWVPIGGATVRLAAEPRSCGVEVPASEARWLVVVLGMLSGDSRPVADLRRSLTIASART